MASFKKKVWYIQKPGKYDSYAGNEETTETVCESDQMLGLVEQEFEIVIIGMFKELKETILEEVKEGMITLPHQIKNKTVKTEIIF